jgi:hypothetical protein
LIHFFLNWFCYKFIFPTICGISNLIWRDQSSGGIDILHKRNQLTKFKIKFRSLISKAADSFNLQKLILSRTILKIVSLKTILYQQQIWFWCFSCWLNEQQHRI